MGRTYEYWAQKDGEDVAIKLTVTHFKNTKGNFSRVAETPEEYLGTQEIEWHTGDDTSFMCQAELTAMRDWLFSEHAEFIADRDHRE